MVELRTLNNKHVTQVNDAWVFKSFQNLDLSQGGDRHAFLFIVH